MKDLRVAGWLHIHPLFFLLAFSAILTGAILDFILLFSIVFIHEMGHFWTARHFNWRVEKLEIWLFGGAVVSEEHHTRPFKEQAAVVLAGPLQHLWIYLLLYGIAMGAGPHPFITTALFYNTLILCFNLLPVWPLDGGKLIFYFFCRMYSFQKSLKRTLLFSALILTAAAGWLFLEQRWTLAAVLLTAFLITEHVLEWRKRAFSHMRYLLFCAYQDREGMKTEYQHVSPDMRIMDAVKHVRPNRRVKYILKQAPHFYIVDEQECLRAYFENKQPYLKFKDIRQFA